MLRLTSFCAVFFVSGMAIEISKSDRGISDGFLSNCPGSQKPAVIKPKSLEKLTISVLGPGNFLAARWTKYNYYNMKKLVEDPEIDLKKKTLLYLPSYLETIKLPVGRIIGSLYKELGYNVLIVDYFEFTVNHFPVAARLTRPLGKHVAEMLLNLTTLGLDIKTVELVGVSMGTHTMGFVGKNYRRMTGQNISSITALDPSGPCFRNLGPDQRLDPSDADFVLTVHTNIDGYGIASPLGHVSVFVNGGEYQPADIWTLPCLIPCSHYRSYTIWMSALINPGIFIAMQCDSVQQARDADCYDRIPQVTNTVDLFTDKSKPGIYYLHTFYRYPYGLGSKGLKRKDNLYRKYIGSLNAEDVLTV